MPVLAPTGQPDRAIDWFHSAPGRAVIDSETDAVRQGLDERPGHPWLWLAAAASALDRRDRGLRLLSVAQAWDGAVRCRLPLPLANDTVATVVLQHVLHSGEPGRALLQECARVLLPGGRLWLFALNPLAPYRWRWQRSGLAASEPMLWRRRLRAAGLQPEPVSHGIGPRWRIEPAAQLQHGPGLRAAYLLRAEKRTMPLTPLRTRASLRIAEGVPAA
ncbi:MAG: class I SAM-dependent methyltransferase [Gammaproteobacteria bacterium]|nr:class I SAM-dependent methyltransferase [Gammaproteobacteria bacterium]